MFLTATVLALLAVAQSDAQGNTRVTEKRGAIGSPSSSSGLSQAQQEAYIARIRQYQQAQAQAQAQAQSQAQHEAQPDNEVRYVQQTAKYTGSPVAYTSGAAPAVHYQQQPQQQAIAYSQPSHRQQASPAYSKAAYQTQSAPTSVPHFSLASDVSTFSYSSPVVKYSNLGLLSQLATKQEEQIINYQSAQQAPAQRVQYYQPQQSQAPAKSRVQYVPQYESYSQQDQKSAEPAQNYVVASQKYASQGAPQQRYVYVSAQEAAQAQAEPSSTGPQQFVYQAVPQSRYQQQAYQAQSQYESKAQAAPSVPQSIYVRVPEQYQPQHFAQQKHGVVYAN